MTRTMFALVLALPAVGYAQGISINGATNPNINGVFDPLQIPTTMLRTFSDANAVPNFTQMFTSTGSAGVGTQPGSTGITAGLQCQYFATIVSGTSMRATATCYDNTAGFSWYRSNAAVAFGSEAWTSSAALSASGQLAVSAVTANYLFGSATASFATNRSYVDSSGFSSTGGSSTTYGNAGLQSRTSTGTLGAQVLCNGALVTGICVSNVAFVSTSTQNTLGTAIASATTIVPTNGIFHVTGTAAISTMTPPSGMSSTVGGFLTLIADGAWSLTPGSTAGQFKSALTAVAGTQYYCTYDGTLWYCK